MTGGNEFLQLQTVHLDSLRQREDGVTSLRLPLGQDTFLTG